MFAKTSFRLTAVYLLILMVISLFFSVTLFTVSAHEIDRGLRRQDTFFESQPIRGFAPNSALQEQFIASRETAAKDAKNRVLVSLVLINVIILLLGGGVSYVLARRSLRPIEEAHQSLEQFTADASHELRTPIAAMRSEIEVALMQPKLTIKEAKTVLSSNLEELETLTQLTSGLLSIARLEENSVVTSVQKVEPIIQTAIKRLEQKAKLQNIKVHPAFTAGLTVRANAESLSEALSTILDNAIKYSSPKSSIDVTTSKSKQHTIIKIKDYGIGIQPDDLPHVFERFYRADTARSKAGAGGHGLGLAIARQLIEHQNGTISITSTPKKTTVVTVTLPSS